MPLVKMSDVAAELGLSVSTVGRALADRPEISQETKARVRDAADRLGYVVNSAAQVMRIGRSTMIGLLVPDVRNDFYGAAAMALARCCDEAGFQLVLAVTRDDPDTELRHVRELAKARAAGVVAAWTVTPRRDTLRLLAGVPAVEFIRRVETTAAPWFGIDDSAALAMSTGHLLDLGHRKVAMLGPSELLSTGRERLKGYREAFTRRSILPPSRFGRLGEPTAQFGRDGFRDLWKGPHRPTAIVTGGAEITVGVLEAIGELGISVPGTLSIVGYGDAPWFRLWGPGLTTIGLPVYDIALACGSFLLRQIAALDRKAGKDASVEGVRYLAMHAPALIERGSAIAAHS